MEEKTEGVERVNKIDDKTKQETHLIQTEHTESYHEWPHTKRKAALAERRLLLTTLAPYLKEKGFAFEHLVHKLSVKIENTQQLFGAAKTVKLNTIMLGQRSSNNTALSIVCCHGYGAGSAFWYRNVPFFLDLTLGEHSGVPPIANVFLVDWLGFGLSSRPPFPHDSDPEKAVDLAESFFISSLEQWRERMGLERFVLVGHSLGGYLSTLYTLKYPQRVQRLILLSPAGLSKPPKELPPLTWPFKLVKTAVSLNLTPYSFMRAAGPLGPSIMRNQIYEGYALPEPQMEALSSYLYQINALSASGEHVIRSILFLGAFAIYGRRGLMDRIGQLQVPVSFYYAEYDWFDFKDAANAIELLKVSSRLGFIKKAGHNSFVHNPEEFATHLLSDLKSI